MDSTVIFCFVLPILFIIGWLVIRSRAAQRQRAELTDAATAYQEALALLKADPTNAALRQRTLAFGRAYASLTRETAGVPVVDEATLLRDLPAAIPIPSVAADSAPNTAGEKSVQGKADE